MSYGALTEIALLAAARLAEDGLEVAVIDARFSKPVDERMLRRELRPGRPVLTLEDHALAGGFGSAVAEAAVRSAVDRRPDPPRPPRPIDRSCHPGAAARRSGAGRRGIGRFGP